LAHQAYHHPEDDAPQGQPVDDKPPAPEPPIEHAAANIPELAERVRHEINLYYHMHVEPDIQHLHRHAVKVAEYLGMEINALNITHVMDVIKHHMVAPSQ